MLLLLPMSWKEGMCFNKKHCLRARQLPKTMERKGETEIPQNETERVGGLEEGERQRIGKEREGKREGHFYPYFIFTHKEISPVTCCMQLRQQTKKPEGALHKIAHTVHLFLRLQITEILFAPVSLHTARPAGAGTWAQLEGVVGTSAPSTGLLPMDRLDNIVWDMNSALSFLRAPVPRWILSFIDMQWKQYKII